MRILKKVKILRFARMGKNDQRLAANTSGINLIVPGEAETGYAGEQPLRDTRLLTAQRFRGCIRCPPAACGIMAHLFNLCH